MGFLPVLVLTSLAASASASGLHGARHTLAPALRREAAATATTTDAPAYTSTNGFCCFEPDTETMAASFVTSCQSRMYSYLSAFPTKPEALESQPFYSGDPCTTSVPASLSSALSSYEAEVVSFFEPISSEYNSFLSTDCTYLSINAFYIVNDMVVGADCTPTAATLQSSPATPATTATTAAATTSTASAGAAGSTGATSAGTGSSGTAGASGSTTGSASGVAATTTSGSMALADRNSGSCVGVVAAAVGLALGALVAI